MGNKETKDYTDTIPWDTISMVPIHNARYNKLGTKMYIKSDDGLLEKVYYLSTPGDETTAVFIKEQSYGN